MVNWDDLRFVRALAQAETMTGAAKILKTNTSTVSRRVERLARDIGISIFHKHRNRWAITKQAEPLLELADQTSRKFDYISESVPHKKSELSDDIYVSCFHSISSISLLRNLDSFHHDYPNITIEIDYNNLRSSIAAGEIDAALVVELPKEGLLVSKRVSTVMTRFYHQRGAEPKRDWIGLSSQFETQPIMEIGRRHFGGSPSVRTGTFSGIRTIIRESNLYGPQMTCLARLDDNLVEIDNPNLVAVAPVYLVYHESRRHDPVLRAVLDWIESVFPSPQSCSCGHCEVATASHASILSN